MGIQTDSGHEGAVLHLFADGASGSSWGAGGPLETTAADGRRIPADRWPEHSPDEIVGWRAICTIYPPDHGYRRCWTGPAWTRVATPADQDLAARKLYWPGGAAFLDPESEDLIMGDWEIHVGPAEELHEVGLAADAVSDAQRTLSQAVRAARDAGASWAGIGRAVGISRQSAHERWAKIVVQAER
ncbi:hypothetical protein ABZV91_22985 [Nocardia sp. NPDC004568]|uniref:hypothetical protein n=1 Tax=Nocardia sp. NPDC004568 TaxID=3154551 RepID=UPI0033AD8BEB